ncbi:Kinesin-like protein KIF9 [Durusdinium trenchii]|uniref:Kinesin-like protein KIF9 n=1 Tax=Durusdinium trenchii TaxID=1381693 RepID=A0ABP0RVI5_9DINO
MGRTNVRVVARARPTSSFASDVFKFNEAADSIDMRLPKDESAGLVNNQQETWHFKLDKVLSNGSQEQIFEICAADVVRSVMDGYNGTILAYGQTGAGKTHTMSGGHMGFADRGIVPRAISAIYAEAAARPENNITIKLSYVEIYNELMFDLLTDVGVAEQSGDLSIVEDSRGNIQVRGLTTPVGGTEEEALHIFFQGDTNRHVAEHALNKGSTRSHVVFTIYVESRSRVESSEKVIFSKLHLVDLAGSERLKKTGSDGVMLKEATFINKSLTFLEQVVVALGSKHRDHIPYRQSKLTHILKDSLGGNCKTTMVANIWPEAKMVEETASTLRFATRMMKVSNEASVNVHLDPQLLIRKYERQIKDLKQELAMHDTLAGRSRVQYEEYAPDEQKELQDKVQMYLEGDLQEIEVTSLRMVYESYAIFRKLYQNLRTELANRPTMPLPPQGGDTEAAEGGPGATATETREGEVGEDVEGKGIAVGVAPANSRPPQEAMAPDAGEDLEDTPGVEPKSARDELQKPPDKQVPAEETAVEQSHERKGYLSKQYSIGEEPLCQAVFAEWKAKDGSTGSCRTKFLPTNATGEVISGTNHVKSPFFRCGTSALPLWLRPMGELPMELPEVREAAWSLICRSPQIYQCDDFLSSEECEAIRSFAESAGSESWNLSFKTRVDLHPEGSSPGAAVLRALDRRIWALSGQRPHEGEMPWAVHVTPGDGGDVRTPLGLHVDTNNGRERRWLTFLIYLKTLEPSEGGHTLFPLAHSLEEGVEEPPVAGEVLLQADLHHTGPASEASQATHVQDAARTLLARAERLASLASSGHSRAACGVAVAPKEGRCVAFWSRSRTGHLDPASWHGGAAVGLGSAKWTLQKFKEAPAEVLKACCIETFAMQHASLQLPCGAGAVRFVEVEEKMHLELAKKHDAWAASQWELGDLIDEEEWALIKNIKETKLQYRDAFEQHSRVKMDVIQIEHLMQQCKSRLVQAFEEFYDQKYGHLVKQEAPEDEGERYDPQEMFDLAEADRLETRHPDAMAYWKARKKAAREVRQKKLRGI